MRYLSAGLKHDRKILQKLNFADRSDFDKLAEIVKELLGKSDDACINPPFYCDYGSHIEVGKNFFANYKRLQKLTDENYFTTKRLMMTPGIGYAHRRKNKVKRSGRICT